jgi:putative peptidoglycan lipid II flippase
MAAWIEFALLRSALNQRIGKTGLNVFFLVKLWIAALLAAGLAFILKLQMSISSPWISGASVLTVYAFLYLGGAAALRVQGALNLAQVISSRLGRKN